MRRRPSFTEQRRRRLARSIGQIEQVEPRSLITDPIGLSALGMGVPFVAGIVGSIDAHASMGGGVTS